MNEYQLESKRKPDSYKTFIRPGKTCHRKSGKNCLTAYSFSTFFAAGPRAPSSISKRTRCPSVRVR